MLFKKAIRDLREGSFTLPVSDVIEARKRVAMKRYLAKQGALYNVNDSTVLLRLMTRQTRDLLRICGHS